MNKPGFRLILATVGAASIAAAANSVPAEFQGRWVPSQAACTSPTAVLVAPDAYNAHIKKLDLAKRFPLAKIALKKCAGG
jgi:hypothetical protein